MPPISTDEIRHLIRSNFPVAPIPSIPEILLHRADPSSGFWRIAGMDENLGTPYWAYEWGGGLALARHILSNPGAVAERRVLDLGSGSGLVAIAAAKAGARHVIAADIDRYAIAAIALNAAANNVTLSPFLGDPTIGGPPDVDVVLVGDLFYERELALHVGAFLDRCRAADIEVLIGDPRRPFLPHKRLRLIAEYLGADFGTREKHNAVFRFEDRKD